MSEKIRMPADLDQVTLKLLGKFDAKDLGRAGLPSSIGFITVYQAQNPSLLSFISLAFSVALGVIWAFWRPWGRTLDQNLYQAFRWTAQKDVSESSEIEDGHIRTDGSLATLIEVEPVNLELKSVTEKAALHQIYQELLKTADYPVEFYSTQTPFNFESYLQDLDSNDKLQKGHRDYCRGLVNEGQNQTRHFVCIRVANNDVEELENRVDEVLEKLNSGAVTAERATELSSSNRPKIKHDHVIYPDSEDRNCSKTVYVSEYPRDIDFSWTTEILQVDGLLDVAQVVEPKSPADTVSQLEKLENKAEAENQSLVRKGYGSSRTLERLLGDIDWFQNLLADQEDQPVEYGVYITAYGQNKDECQSTLRKVQNRLKTLGIEYKDTALRTDQSHCSATPGHSDKLNEKLLVPAGSAASGFPFTSPSSIDENGVLFGVQDTTESPVVLDRFKWNAGHQVLAGVTGSGKTFYSKLQLLRSSLIYDDLHINIVDPKPEYGETEEKLERYATVTRFHPEESIQDTTEDLIQAVGEAYQDAKNTSGKTIVVIDEAHRLLKTEEGASVLSTLVREARSSNTAVTLITQTTSDFYRTEDGSDILKNIPCKVLFAHEKADDRPAQAFNLSNIAETSLYNLTKGDQDGTDHSKAILAVSNQLESKIKIEASQTEKAIIENGEIPEPEEIPVESSDEKQHYIAEDSETGTSESSSPSIRDRVAEVELPSLPSFSLSSTESTQDEAAHTEERRIQWKDYVPDYDLSESTRDALTGYLMLAGMFGLVLLSFGVSSLLATGLQTALQLGEFATGLLEIILVIPVMTAVIGLSDAFDTSGMEDKQ